MQNPERFEKFYFAKVGMGEACGCAERIIDVFEFNRKGGAQSRQPVKQDRRRRGSFRAWAVKYGLMSRRRT
ncbi:MULTISPECIES: hypothetical protein [Ruegeria]|jgi:hypothetical protein|uniref:Uncharacterized protein n=1 Tax=Ruegeria atlantica TaxID=81569 RepID=A0AA91BZV8_9RHOB|nr:MULTISPECIES: hypothetical protein [Ruegeria]MCA0908740.1 hypothetical protein [Ruegeria marisrubri]NOC85973.1 hypothetical protein [Ruegeria sp. HKCCD6428]NOC92589.1 hypothetical protein [Ruegeria sp. HKCCD6604]NOD32779.1 hypothetical protein [Ruegeria atlantica]NOD99747.1 hypothetical protein [Ruegeria sp. HKCCD6228]